MFGERRLEAGDRLMGERLLVDPIRCDGYGMCAEMFPEGIALDDWGYPMLRTGTIPDQLVGLARQAVDVCPALALRLVKASTAGAPRPALDRFRTAERVSRT
jgi:ferredoxin